MYAVAGQHDLPNHRLDAMGKSAYGVLVKTGLIQHLETKSPLEITSRGVALRLHGHSWGTPVEPLRSPHDLLLEVAVVHRYVWTRKTGYPGALEESRLGKFQKILKGFEAVVVGDNHKPFSRPSKNRLPSVFGPGGFIRRKIDERDHRPSVGLLFSDGTVRRHHLDVSGDKFIDTPGAAEVLKSAGLQELLDELGNLADKALDFREAVTRRLEREGVPAPVRKIAMEAMDHDRV